jgi:hypothetical protein
MPEEAINWIIDNQLGRRNLTAAQKIAVAEQMLTIEDKIKMDEEAREAQRQNLKNHKREKIDVVPPVPESREKSSKEVADRLAKKESGEIGANKEEIFAKVIPDKD